MLLDMTYEEALALYGDDAVEQVEGSGFGDYHMESILVERGFAIAKRFKVLQPGNRQRDTWPPSPWADARFCAIVKHASGLSHSVAMLADGTVLDPNSETRTRLSDFQEVCSVSAIVPISKELTQ